VRTNKLNKKQLSKVASEVAQADALMKYAFNNIEFTHSIKEIAEGCDSFDDFMGALAFHSKQFFNECVKSNKQLFETSCKFNNYSLKQIIEDFDAFYN
jgi:enoyl-[acyl-carrier-protein] reductase (NADH)